jgi:sarcosine oxidase subunit delta
LRTDEQDRKNFFFEKKKQKTFVRCRGPFPKARPKKQKFFGSFFQKRTFLPAFGSTPMLLIPCPYCGPRPELEFRYAGEAHVARAAQPASVNDEDWAGFLYMRTNPRGLHAERWRHTHGCARFFNALRNTLTDQFVASYTVGEKRPDGAA